MTGDAELVTGDPRWHIFLLGTSPLGLFFTGVEASGALSRDVYLIWKKFLLEFSSFYTEFVFLGSYNHMKH